MFIEENSTLDPSTPLVFIPKIIDIRKTPSDWMLKFCGISGKENRRIRKKIEKYGRHRVKVKPRELITKMD